MHSLSSGPTLTHTHLQYGLIYHSSFISRAGPKHKGRISRFLANKCSIASRIDCFSGIHSTPAREPVI